VEAQAAERRRQAQRDAPARAARRAHHTPTPRRGYRARGLPVVAARRLRTVLGGGPHDQAAHRAATPGTGRGPPFTPSKEFCRAGRGGPGRGHGAEPRSPVAGLPGPGGDHGPDTWAPAPGPARPAVGSLS